MKHRSSLQAGLCACLAFTTIPAAFAQDARLPDTSLVQALPDNSKAPDTVPAAYKDLWAPLGRPRLLKVPFAGDAATLAPELFAVDPLAPSEKDGLRSEQRGNTRILSISALKSWSRPLRATSEQPVYVSFQVYASPETVIDVGNVRLRVTESPVPDSVQLVAMESGGSNPSWRPLGIHVRQDMFGDRMLAALPVLTILYDAKAGVWDLFADARQVASNMRVSATGGSGQKTQQVSVSGGKSGAWVSGLIQSAANPLFADDNMNGIDDAFEMERLQRLMPRYSSLDDRVTMAEQWRRDRQGKRPAALLGDQPRANRLTAKQAKPQQ